MRMPMGITDFRERHPRVVDAFLHALREDRLHHAYILASSDLAESKALVTAMGQSLVCTERGSSPDACGVCVACRTYVGENHPDVLTLSPNEKNVIPIDAIRALTGRLALKSTSGQRKIVRILQADRMNPAAQNALLKTLEEPSGETCFFLTAARPRSLLITVRSRCQRLQLGAPSLEDAARALSEGGVDKGLATLLVPLVGADVERAGELLERGFAEIASLVDDVLSNPDNQSQALRTAKDLGSDRERADLALALLEVRVRDALASQHSDVPLLDAPRLATLSRDVLGELVGKLQELRRLANRSVNRTLALEAIFLNLAR